MFACDLWMLGWFRFIFHLCLWPYPARTLLYNMRRLVRQMLFPARSKLIIRTLRICRCRYHSRMIGIVMHFYIIHTTT